MPLSLRIPLAASSSLGVVLCRNNPVPASLRGRWHPEAGRRRDDNGVRRRRLRRSMRSRGRAWESRRRATSGESVAPPSSYAEDPARVSTLSREGRKDGCRRKAGQLTWLEPSSKCTCGWDAPAGGVPRILFVRTMLVWQQCGKSAFCLFFVSFTTLVFLQLLFLCRRHDPFCLLLLFFKVILVFFPVFNASF